MQRLLCTVPHGHAHPDDEPRPIPRAQVPRKIGARVPTMPRQLPDHRHDRVAAHRHPELSPKVARRIFVVVVVAATHLTVGRGANRSAAVLVRAGSSC